MDSMAPFLIHTRRFPPRNYHAITIFPFIFYNGMKLDESEMRHEMVHLRQQIALVILPFYLLYLLFWLSNLVRYRDKDLAYRNIPFERSAYCLENQQSVTPLRQSFHWLCCLKNNKL